MKLLVKVVISVLVSTLWLFGAYKAGGWLGELLANWINED